MFVSWLEHIFHLCYVTYPSICVLRPFQFLSCWYIWILLKWHCSLHHLGFVPAFLLLSNRTENLTVYGGGGGGTWECSHSIVARTWCHVWEPNRFFILMPFECVHQSLVLGQGILHKSSNNNYDKTELSNCVPRPPGISCVLLTKRNNFIPDFCRVNSGRLVMTFMEVEERWSWKNKCFFHHNRWAKTS